MTKENSKRLYEHYVKIGYTKAAENMLAKYPEFRKTPAPKKEVEKTKKSE